MLIIDKVEIDPQLLRYRYNRVQKINKESYRAPLIKRARVSFSGPWECRLVFRYKLTIISNGKITF